MRPNHKRSFHHKVDKSHDIQLVHPILHGLNKEFLIRSVLIQSEPKRAKKGQKGPERARKGQKGPKKAKKSHVIQLVHPIVPYLCRRIYILNKIRQSQLLLIHRILLTLSLVSFRFKIH